MQNTSCRIFLSLLIFFFVVTSPIKAEIINKISIDGNERISSETIQMFSGVSLNDDLFDNDLNEILKKLYNTLLIEVKENPIIQNIYYEGIKSTKILADLKKNIVLKSRSSFNEVLLEQDRQNIKSFLKEIGYYFSNIEISITELEDNKINLFYNISLGEKAKIRKISFVGDKIFKDKKLKSVILSEEYKPWKFLSGKKYLNESIIRYDEKLLKNFYLNKGYYNVVINSSFAKMTDEESFELLFNIDAK